MPLKAYCEHGALTTDIRRLVKEGTLELYHFPYDQKSSLRKKKWVKLALPSGARWCDNDLRWSDCGNVTWDQLKPSDRFAAIELIIGHSHRCDALHLDSAYKSGCVLFITPDRGDIVKHADALFALLNIQCYWVRDVGQINDFCLKAQAGYPQSTLQALP